MGWIRESLQIKGPRECINYYVFPQLENSRFSRFCCTSEANIKAVTHSVFYRSIGAQVSFEKLSLKKQTVDLELEMSVTFIWNSLETLETV